MLHIFFFFNDTATTEIYTLSLHDALPILRHLSSRQFASNRKHRGAPTPVQGPVAGTAIRVISDKTLTRRSEEHTSELQSQSNLVCRLLLEKKKNHEVHTMHTINTNIARLH